MRLTQAASQETLQLMRWYTRQWQHGDLTDADADAREPEYVAYVRSVADRMPAHILDFALPTSVHVAVDDAKVDRADIDIRRRSIRLRLLNGDLQAGYGKLDLEFVDAELIEPTVERLRSLLENPETEFLRQEVELSEERSLSMDVRFLLWPEGQIAIRCRDLRVSWQAVEDDTRSDYRNEVAIQS